MTLACVERTLRFEQLCKLHTEMYEIVSVPMRLIFACICIHFAPHPAVQDSCMKPDHCYCIYSNLPGVKWLPLQLQPWDPPCVDTKRGIW